MQTNMTFCGQFVIRASLSCCWTQGLNFCVASILLRCLLYEIFGLKSIESMLLLLPNQNTPDLIYSVRALFQCNHHFADLLMANNDTWKQKTTSLTVCSTSQKMNRSVVQRCFDCGSCQLSMSCFELVRALNFVEGHQRTLNRLSLAWLQEGRFSWNLPF